MNDYRLQTKFIWRMSPTGRLHVTRMHANAIGSIIYRRYNFITARPAHSFHKNIKRNILDHNTGYEDLSYLLDRRSNVLNKARWRRYHGGYSIIRIASHHEVSISKLKRAMHTAKEYISKVDRFEKERKAGAENASK